MKIIIVKDVDSLKQLSRPKVYESHLIGFWDGDECVIVKDRLFGSINLRLNSERLTDYIYEYEKVYK